MKKLWLFCVFLMLLPAISRGGENLLKNPGFEDGADSSSWADCNWARWDLQTAIDPDNPHSGIACKRIVVQKIHEAGDFHVAQHIFVKGGASYSIRFWMRGKSNSAPAHMLIRQQPAPYTIYFTASMMLTEQWQEFAFNFTLPEKIDEPHIALLFSVRDETSVWIDDVSLTELPAQEPREPLVGNQIRNGSFEVGRDGWTATFRESGGAAACPEANESNSAQSIVSLTAPDAPEGSRVLSFKVRHSCSVALTSGYFPLRYGHPAKVSFWLKGNVEGLNFTAAVGGGRFPNMSWTREKFITESNGWKRYEFVASPRPNSTGTYLIEIATNQPGTYTIDDVVIADAESPSSAVENKLTAGFEAAPESDPANLFDKNQKVEFILNVQSRDKVELPAEIIDAWGRKLREFHIAVSGSEKGVSSVPVAMDTSEYGGFKCTVFVPNSRSPLADVIYSVLPKLKPLKEVQDSFFGSHVLLTHYNLHIAERAGFRWLRLHDANVSTKWMVVEPQKGQWNIDLRAVKRASEQGFKLLGMFDTTPPSYADAPADIDKNRGNWPPANWDAWKEYVKRVATDFGPYIQAWEVWNEPDGGFLLVPSGKEKATVYRQLVKTAREALDEIHNESPLLAGAVTSLLRPFTKEVLDLGAGQDIDFYSFHYYDGCAGKSPEETDFFAEIDRVHSYKDHHGEPLQVWHTEGSATCPSWLDSLHIVTGDQIGVGDYATILVRSAAAFKAIGVKRYFHYDSCAHPAGYITYRRLTDMMDTNGIPQPSLAAHAVMVSYLEDAEPAGLQRLADKMVTVASFKRHGKNLNVVWARPDISIGKVAQLDYKGRLAYDIMGNPITLTPDSRLTTKPIYIIDK